MMAIDLSIPAYQGGYRMDADALQAEMVEVQCLLIGAVLSYDERRAVQAELTKQYQHSDRGFPGHNDIVFAQIARVQELLPERGGNKDVHGWAVEELIKRFQELRTQMEREYGLIR